MAWGWLELWAGTPVFFQLVSGLKACVSVDKWGIDTARLDPVSSWLDWSRPPHISPHLHLTTSKVMVIVWRLRGNIIIPVLYIANVLPLKWAQLTRTVHTARLGLEFVFLCFFRLHDLSLCWCFVLPWTVESFPFMLSRWRYKLKWAPLRAFCSLPIIKG